jgi:hypothetical protein
MTPKWAVIAKNEFRTRTARIRRIRRLYPFILMGGLAVYVFLLAPAIVSSFLDSALRLLVSEAALSIVQLTTFMVFLYFLIIPVTETLRRPEWNRVEILLASPISPSDLLFGEYLGEFPSYGILITLIAGGFAAILSPLGLGPMATTVVILIFLLIALSAMWLGTVIAAVLRTRIEKFAGGKDLGRAIAMILPLPLVAMVYAFIGGGLQEALMNPETTEWLSRTLAFLPSSWAAKAVVQVVSSQGDLASLSIQALTGLVMLVVFFLASIWVGLKIAGRAYSFDRVAITSPIAGPEGLPARFMRRIGRGTFGTLLASVFKDYTRYLQNLSNITYVVGIFALINLLIPSEPGEPPMYVLGSLFLCPLIVVMVAADVTVDSREKIRVFKKAPSGMWKFLKTMLVKGWVVVAAVTGTITFIAGILQPSVQIPWVVAASGLLTLIAAANVPFVIGLFLLNPAFSDKSVRIWVNIIICIFVQILLFVASLAVLTPAEEFVLSEEIFRVLFVDALLSWCLGALFLSIGKMKLDRME